MQDHQLKMTYGKHSVYSKPFSIAPPPSPEVLDSIETELNKFFASKVDIPLGAEIDCEYVEATMATGMYGFMEMVVEDVTPDKNNK